MRQDDAAGGHAAGLKERLAGGRAVRVGFLLAILFLAGFYTYIAFTGLSYLSSAGRLGPAFMPRIIGVALIAMCLFSLYGDLKGASTEEGLSSGWRTAAVLALLCIVFVGLLEVIGGLLAMMVFMAASLWTLNRGRHLQNALIAILLPVGTYVVFSVWLKASMPRGLLPF